ncbi:MAG: hypothetical protein DRQ55_18890 [Planctomycetota bacterium]|nr:MAG: hypothetical protein DRQ55_18890 [Planctomycetota bacterium]
MILLTGLLSLSLTTQVATGLVQTQPATAHAVESGQRPSSRQETDTPRSYEIGHLRHLHWLPTKDGVQRLATVARVVTGTDLRSTAHATPRATLVQIRDIAGVLEAQLSVPFDLLPVNSWTHALTWRVIQLESGLALALVDRKGQRFHLLHFTSGEPLAASRSAMRLLDVRQQAAGAECLVESDEGLERLVIRADGKAVTAATLATGLDKIGAASFVSTFGTAVTPADDVWASGWKDGELAIVRLGAEEPHPILLKLAVTPTRGTKLRLDATRRAGRTWLAIGNPNYRSGTGRIAVAEVLDDEVKILWDGRPDAEMIGDMWDQRDYGQCVAFVPDADGDGVPDLIVSGPWSWVDTCVDLLSVAGGRRLFQDTAMRVHATGHSLDISADGERVLLGGADWRDYPENLTHTGIGRVLNTSDLKGEVRIVIAPTEIDPAAKRTMK